MYNASFYFPIRLIDSKEILDEVYIANVLPIDLASKGNVIFKVSGFLLSELSQTIQLWHRASEFAMQLLGIAEVPLSKLTAEDATVELRCLGEGLDSVEGGQGRTQRPAAFRYEVCNDRLCPSVACFI